MPPAIGIGRVQWCPTPSRRQRAPVATTTRGKPNSSTDAASSSESK